MTYPALFVAVAMLTLFAAHARVSAQLVRPPPLITHAVADHALRSLHITGTDFGTLLPTVNLADVSLGVTTFSDTDIVATLPPGLARGSYWLVVIRPEPVPVSVQVHSLPFQVTLGAVGPPFSHKSVFAPCPAGKLPISGGVLTAGAMNVTDNGPETAGGRAGWRGGVFNPQVGSSDVVVIAVCVAKPSP